MVCQPKVQLLPHRMRRRQAVVAGSSSRRRRVMTTPRHRSLAAMTRLQRLKAEALPAVDTRGHLMSVRKQKRVMRWTKRVLAALVAPPPRVFTCVPS